MSSGNSLVPGKELYQWRLQAQSEAQKAEVPLYEIDWFLQGVSNLSQTDLSLDLYRDRPELPLRHSLHWLTQQWQRRLNDRVPVQYLVGEMPWRDLMLTVTPAVLIPRPETELIIEIVHAWVKDQKPKSPQVWADLGTGSGAIAIALAKLFPRAQILAIDISTAALEIAHQNAQRNNVSNIHFYQGNWISPLHNWQNQLSGIVTNPPYIPSSTVLNLDPEVTNHEPHQALDGGDDGLNDIRHLATQAPHFLKPGGLWLTEHMQGQSEEICTFVAQTGVYHKIQSHQDLAGIERFVTAIFKPSSP